MRLFVRCNLLSWQAQKPRAGICRLGTNQLAGRCPLRPLGNFHGGRRHPCVEVLPPADRGEAGLEQSGEVRPARAGSGGNYCRGYVLTLLLYLAKRTVWPFARLAEVIAAAAHVGNAGIT